VQNIVPPGCGRGIAFVELGSKGSLFEAGTVGEAWKIVKPEPAGPKGWNGLRRTSEDIMEVPSALWEVVTRRGSGSEAMVDNSVNF
jgi:hypothetical protein